MEDSIIIKLKNFLMDHDPVTEECHIVYLLAEIRKLMERTKCNESKFQILRFLCNKRNQLLNCNSSIMTIKRIVIKVSI